MSGALKSPVRIKLQSVGIAYREAKSSVNKSSEHAGGIYKQQIIVLGWVLSSTSLNSGQVVTSSIDGSCSQTATNTPPPLEDLSQR